MFKTQEVDLYGSLNKGGARLSVVKLKDGQILYDNPDNPEQNGQPVKTEDLGEIQWDDEDDYIPTALQLSRAMRPRPGDEDDVPQKAPRQWD